MALLDNRIESRRDCVLGIARGNLAYSRFMFSVYPQYALSLETKDLDQVLAFVHEFERSDLMKPGNKVFSITYLVAYALTSSHHSIDYKKKEYMEIDDLFSKVGSVEVSKFATIKPIDESWAIDIAKTKRLIGQKPLIQDKSRKSYTGETSSSHHSIDYKKKEYIEIDDLFSEVGSVEGSKFATIKPIDESWAIDIAKNKRLIGQKPLIQDKSRKSYTGETSSDVTQRIDYHSNKDLEIIKEQDHARRVLTKVQLVNICSLDKYTCIYEKNLYKIPLGEHPQWIEAYLMKIPII
nr:hypothetical protein [Tanacetum cinerariifolium]